MENSAAHLIHRLYREVMQPAQQQGARLYALWLMYPIPAM